MAVHRGFRRQHHAAERRQFEGDVARGGRGESHPRIPDAGGDSAGEAHRAAPGVARVVHHEEDVAGLRAAVRGAEGALLATHATKRGLVTGVEQIHKQRGPGVRQVDPVRGETGDFGVGEGRALRQ